MGVAVSMLGWTEPSAGDYGARLSAAGYVLTDELNLWLHPGLDRALDARIAALLTPAQLKAWIAAAR